jgi:S1-C subfamily serine protease
MPGDFDFFNDEPAAPPRPRPARAADPDDDRPARPTRTRRRPRDGDEDEPGPRPRGPAPKSRLSPLLIVAIIAGSFLVLAGGVVVIVLAVGGGSKPTEPKDKGGPPAAVTKPLQPPKKAPEDLNTPTPETVERVKKATVRILVQSPRQKGIASGSGFVEKDSRMVLTNAHVVGMKKVTDPEPLINLIVNSGMGDQEYPLDGEVVAVDAANDLAVIRPLLLKAGERTPVPDGLVVPKTSAVKELDNLFVFGFPLGSSIGKEISVRPTKVTSLRHDPATGKLNKIQVEGGMTFGNSGGPVVDVKGNVIGVAVSGIKEANINFCVPGEMVQQLLANRKSWKE